MIIACQISQLNIFLYYLYYLLTFFCIIFRIFCSQFAEPQFALSLPNGSWRKSLLLAVLVLVLLLSAGAFYARCWLPLALLYKDKFGRLEENGKFKYK